MSKSGFKDESKKTFNSLISEWYNHIDIARFEKQYSKELLVMEFRNTV